MDNRDAAIKVGDIFIDIEKECYDIKHVTGDLIGIPYVLAQVDWDSVALLNIFNGNRYSDPVTVKDISNVNCFIELLKKPLGGSIIGRK